MWEWIVSNGGYLVLTVIAGGYFVFYVAAIRTQRKDPRKPKLPRDRC